MEVFEGLRGFEVWVVWVVRLVKKRQLAPYIPNKTHFLTMPQVAGKQVKDTK